MILAVLKTVAISIVITGGIALGLIVSQRPGQTDADQAVGLSFAGLLARDDAPLAVQDKTLRDGTVAKVRHVSGPEGAPLVVLVHGSGWDGGQFDGLGAELSTVADVLVPDLRGHGAAPDRRGDVDYVGQMEDDLAELIGAYKVVQDQHIILLGHSSGGGLVIRFANGAHGALIDGAVLMAPFVHHAAPTMRAQSGGWAHPLTRRIVGLSMLNMVGIHALDHLVAIEFNMPDAVLSGPEGHRATTAYSWRLNQGYAPRGDWKADVAALPDFLLIAGTEDEAFRAEIYEPAFTKLTDRGQYHLLPGIGHLDVVNDPQASELIRNFVTDG